MVVVVPLWRTVVVWDVPAERDLHAVCLLDGGTVHPGHFAGRPSLVCFVASSLFRFHHHAPSRFGKPHLSVRPMQPKSALPLPPVLLDLCSPVGYYCGSIIGLSRPKGTESLSACPYWLCACMHCKSGRPLHQWAALPKLDRAGKPTMSTTAAAAAV